MRNHEAGSTRQLGDKLPQPVCRLPPALPIFERIADAVDLILLLLGESVEVNSLKPAAVDLPQCATLPQPPFFALVAEKDISVLSGALQIRAMHSI